VRVLAPAGQRQPRQQEGGFVGLEPGHDAVAVPGLEAAEEPHPPD